MDPIINKLSLMATFLYSLLGDIMAVLSQATDTSKYHDLPF